MENLDSERKQKIKRHLINNKIMKKSEISNFIIKDGGNEFDVLLKNFRYAVMTLEAIYNITSVAHKQIMTQRNNDLEKRINELNEKDKKDFDELSRAVFTLDHDKFIGFDHSNKTNAFHQLTLDFQKNEIIFNFSIVTMREMALVYHTAQFETFLEMSLIVIFLMRPESLKSKQKTISYEDLFENMDNVLTYLAQTEAKKILKLNIDDLAQKLIEFCNVDLTKNEHWKKFREYFYRRNIIVHNNTVPDKTYLEKVENVKQYSRLIISDEYLTESFKITLEFAKIIHDNFVKKFVKSKT